MPSGHGTRYSRFLTQLMTKAWGILFFNLRIGMGIRRSGPKGVDVLNARKVRAAAYRMLKQRRSINISLPSYFDY